ncbi:molybdopterin-synthase adenylyltransferase MoeB [Paucibacter sp. TC2R-5]|uniref:HesA/MoeB/ThiF family protein n=1 Tax=Paucibacter sp. TC2R-5 TaxID=2893555 RepID=UPI0021E4DBC8|nr:molybdopterin-synthase adenylyltransferase MoeB [Paucibacter sp. TC2R-5]MCV2357456.1 molybdopterin-synthase adenylyltransferase MoeB [Paucibacter sp. TC2R-5]
MNDKQLLRYSRHIFLDEIGIEGQQRLLAAHALIIGAGGLGSPAALYLASAGVGHITLVDDDAVDLTNLQRQIVHNMDRVGLPKVESAALGLAAINPEVRVSALRQRADAALLDELVAQADVVLDCSDNFATRQAINRACVKHAKPLVAGAAIGFDGQISVYDSRQPAAPCYACVFPPDSQFEEARCASMGVFAPLVGVIGSMQAAEGLKLLLGLSGSLAGRLQMLDGRRMEWNEIVVQADPRCSVCSSTKTENAHETTT